MIILAIFALGNSTDAFLLLRLTEVAGSPKFVPLMWAGIHVVKSAVSFVGGSWSDRVGRRAVISTGWIIYAIVYAGFAFSSSLAALLTWFMIYGCYFGFAEGTEKALVADLAPASSRGTAFASAPPWRSARARRSRSSRRRCFSSRYNRSPSCVASSSPMMTAIVQKVCLRSQTRCGRSVMSRSLRR